MTGAGVLTFKAAPDFEAARNSYTLVIEVRDSKDGAGKADTDWDDAVTLTVNVTDVAEPPDAPADLAVSSTANGLTVTWTAPVMTGKPPLTGYDVEQRLRTSAAGAVTPVWGAWTDASHTGTAASASITGLTPEATYQVRVRAVNAEGNGEWAGPEEGVPEQPNRAPTFDDGLTASVNAAENQTAVATPEVTDPDGDDLTYRLDTAAVVSAPATNDHASFTMTGAGVLTFKAAPDFEAARNTYTLVIEVRDSKDGAGKADTDWDDAVTLTVNVTDVAEPPDAPADLAVSSTANGLTVTWTAPVMTGKPPLTGYDVEQRLRTSAAGAVTPVWGAWTDASHTGTAASASITGLTPEATYQVRVRAVNAEGNGEWAGPEEGVPEQPNRAPTFDDGLTASVNAAENQTAVATPEVTDPDGDDLTYRLDTAAVVSAPATNDHASFTMTGAGVLTFKAAPDFEAARNTYTLVIEVRDSKDGAGKADTDWDDAVTLTVNVTDVAEPPDAPADLAVSSTANGLTVTWTAPVMTGKPPLTGYDVEHRLRTSAAGAVNAVWSAWTDLSHGTTTASASITGLTPEATYQVRVRAVNAEGNGEWAGPEEGVPEQPNRAPAFDDGLTASVNAAENQTAVATPDVTDLDGDDLTYRLDTAAMVSAPATNDHALFTMTGAGVLTFKAAPDFEAARNTYTLVIEVRDSKDVNGDGDTDWDDSIILTINVTDLNEAPSFDDGETASVNAAENQTAVATPEVTDPEKDDLTYRLDTAAAVSAPATNDHASFTMTGAGVLTFNAAPDFEAARNTYTLVIEVRDSKDGAGKADTDWDDAVTLTVNVTDVAEPPDAPADLAVSSTANGLTVTWTAPVMTGKPPLTGYDVEQRLRTSAAGAVTPVWGAWTDASHTGTAASASITGLTPEATYQVRVRAVNAEGNGEWAGPEEGVPEQPNRAPTFDDGLTASVNAAENQTAVATPEVTDPDGDDLTYRLDTAAVVSAPATNDHASFTMTGAGVLTFKAAPDFEAARNTYTLVIEVRDSKDGAGKADTDWDDAVTLTVNVTDVAEPPDAPADLAVSSTANGLTVTWTAPVMTGKPPLTGYDVEHRLRTSAAGAVNAVWSAWTDLSHGTTTASASITGLTPEATYQVRVRAVNAEGNGEWAGPEEGVPEQPNRAPAFPSGSVTLDVDENTAPGTAIDDAGSALTATDLDGDSLTYSLGGTDSAHFDIVAGSGQLQTKGALDHEKKASYSVVVTASDGTLTDTIAVTINVNDLNEAPSFDDGETASVNAAENQTAVATPEVTDPDGDDLTYRLDTAAVVSAPATNDHASFTMTGAGVLTFNAAPDFEAVRNSYTLVIEVRDSKDGAGKADTDWDDAVTLTVNVTDVAEPPDAPADLAVSSTANGLTVTWTAPVMTGKPPLTGYDVEQRLRTSAAGAVNAVWSAWTDLSHGTTTASASITGLTPEATYQVRVRAVNAEGNGEWAGPEEGVPEHPNRAPAFDDGPSRTQRRTRRRWPRRR